MITYENAFFFYRLLLAHYIADFPLQTSKVYYLKTKGVLGGTVHAIIVAVTSALFLLPVIQHFWPYAVLLGIIHLFEDEVRIVIGRRFNIDNLWLFLLDQFLHVFVIWWILILSRPWEHYIPQVYENKLPGHSFNFWNYYYDDVSVIKFMFFIVVTFAGTVLFMYMEKYWMPKKYCIRIGEPRQILSLIERGGLFGLALLQQWLIIVSWIIARFLIWLYYYKQINLQQNKQQLSLSLFDFLFVFFAHTVMMWIIGR